MGVEVGVGVGVGVGVVSGAGDKVVAGIGDGVDEGGLGVCVVLIVGTAFAGAVFVLPDTGSVEFQLCVQRSTAIINNPPTNTKSKRVESALFFLGSCVSSTSMLADLYPAAPASGCHDVLLPESVCVCS